jgi:hypothetical protein
MLALVPLLVSLAFRGVANPPVVHDDLANTRWDELVAKVQAGETLAGVTAAVLHTAEGNTEHIYVPSAQEDFTQARGDLGLRRGKNPPFIDPNQLKVFDRVGGL